MNNPLVIGLLVLVALGIILPLVSSFAKAVVVVAIIAVAYKLFKSKNK